MTKPLWAPWRLEYIQAADEQEGCVFCLAAEGDDEEKLVVHRGRRAFVLLNKFPYSSGHLMVAPFRSWYAAHPAPSAAKPTAVGQRRAAQRSSRSRSALTPTAVTKAGASTTAWRRVADASTIAARRSPCRAGVGRTSVAAMAHAASTSTG